MSVERDMQRAVALHQRGELAAAEAAYAAILARAPAFADARQLRGVALSQLGRHDEAIAAIGEALRSQPQHPVWRHNLGKALHDAGRLAEAVGHYRQALAVVPGMVEAWLNLGNARRDLGEPDDALRCFEQVLALDPRHARALNNAGNLLQKQKHHARAQALLERALAVKPDYAEAHCNLGIVRAACKDPAGALAAYARAIELAPGFAEPHMNRGNTLLELDRVEEAIAAFERAIALKPSLSEAVNNLGNARLALGDVDAAAACYERAVALAPADASAHFNRALLYLSRGDFARGWPEYEWGLRAELRQPQRPFTQPAWQGERFDGRTLLVHSEQGLGDTLQFLRYLPAVRARGGRVILEVQRELVALVARAGLADVVQERRADGALVEPFDLHVTQMSLPLALGLVQADAIPPPVALPVDPARQARWQARIGREGRRIGLVWAGNPEHRNDARRSMALVRLAPLATLPGIRLLSLQKGTAAADIARTGLPVEDLGRELDDFDDTAAVLRCLDLVVSVDTAVAHLAGTQGVPTCVLLPFAPDWRWQRDRNDSPWYPALRLFRQPRRGDWDAVIAQVRDALRG